MEFRTRHQAMAWYGVIALLVIATNYGQGVVLSIQDALLLIGPFIAMFTWDKIKPGSIIKPSS